MNVFDLLEKYLKGEYDAEEFSFDFPAYLCVQNKIIRKNAPELADELGDELPSICASYEDEIKDEVYQQVKAEYDRLKPMIDDYRQKFDVRDLFENIYRK